MHCVYVIKLIDIFFDSKYSRCQNVIHVNPIELAIYLLIAETDVSIFIAIVSVSLV